MSCDQENPKIINGRPPMGGPPEIPMADVSFVEKKFLDIPYAPISPSQKLDIYLPANGQGPFPVLLEIHGGGFMIGDKRDTHLLPFLGALERGFAVVSVEYRLSREAIFPAAVQDVKAAVRWIRANQDKYFLDGSRIAACGGSAGGNLAVMLGVTGGTKVFDDPALGNLDFSSEVQAVVDWFGPVDFLHMDEQAVQNGIGMADHNAPFSPESQYMGAPIQTIPEEVKKANPLIYLHAGLPPFFIQHGDSDPLVPVQQSMALYKALGSYLATDNLQFEIIEGAEHGDPKFETKGNMAKVFTFLKTHLKD
jgi:acetyl esterase/lipase